MSFPKTTEINGRCFLWRDLLKMTREQRKRIVRDEEDERAAKQAKPRTICEAIPKRSRRMSDA